MYIEKIVAAVIAAVLALSVVSAGRAILDGIKSVDVVRPYVEYAEEVVGAEEVFSMLEEASSGSPGEVEDE